MKKTKPTKKELLESKKQTQDKYKICGLWQTMCGYIVLMFVKELISGHYLINLAIDGLVAVVAFYITLHNLASQHKLIQVNKITKKPFIVQIVGMAVGLFIAIITAASPFDITFLILVIAFLTSQKMFEKELNK